ncbi:MAG: sodium:proton antiporter [Methyloceanibacter sp.]|nr:sodium:proton antiporter [Methyloceanibacter sp.]
MPTIYEFIARLLVITALFAWINHRYLRLPNTVGIMAMGICASLLLIALEIVAPQIALIGQIEGHLRTMDFSYALLHGMLAFLLFAGAIQIDLSLLRARAWSVGAMATVGVIISTVLVAGLIWGVSHLLPQPIPFAWALVFGALISPTDPVAVLSVLKQARVAKSIEMDMAGESLFNDGVSVVLFTVLLSAAMSGSGESGIDFGRIAELFFIEALGGAALGLLTGYIAYLGLRSLDDYPTEILILLALVTGTYAFAQNHGFSGPIAVVVAGVLIGNRGRRLAMDDDTERYIYEFWGLVDEILNSILFLLIGLEVIVVQFDMSLLPLAITAIPIVLAARFFAVALPMAFVGFKQRYVKGAVPILTWGGVRGGVSVALALTIPHVDSRPQILAATYAVVLFSLVVQALTLPAVVRYFAHPTRDQE